MEILKWLDNSKIVAEYSVVEFKIFSKGFYIKINVQLIDSSELFIREYSDEKERNYSYHWQNKEKKLILRWDNSPYHPERITAPHHKHTPTGIEPTKETTLKEIIEVVANRLNQK